MTPMDLRNIHTTGNSYREALPCANMALKLPRYFYLLMEKPLGCYLFWCKLSSPFVVADPQERSFELFRMQISQNFPGRCPWTPLRKSYSPPDSPPAQRFFSLLHSLKNWLPQKIAGYGTDQVPF